MNARRRIAGLVVAVAVAVATAWYAGGQFGTPAQLPPAGSIRLGPDAGEPVPGYLARLDATLPPQGAVAPALVQFDAELSITQALVAVDGAVPGTVVFRVPLPRVQTALRFEMLERGVPAATALDTARERAMAAAVDDSGRLSGRQRDVAGVEAAALADPACRCVLGLVVTADRAVLDSIAGRSGVRAVHAAPPGSTPRELAVAPLLPDQTERADPLPDDGTVQPQPR